MCVGAARLSGCNSGLLCDPNRSQAASQRPFTAAAKAAASFKMVPNVLHSLLSRGGTLLLSPQLPSTHGVLEDTPELLNQFLGAF